MVCEKCGTTSHMEFIQEYECPFCGADLSDYETQVLPKAPKKQKTLPKQLWKLLKLRERYVLRLQLTDGFSKKLLGESVHMPDADNTPVEYDLSEYTKYLKETHKKLNEYNRIRAELLASITTCERKIYEMYGYRVQSDGTLAK